MLPGMELMGCAELAVPAEVMRHVVRVESSFNRYAIGVVGGRLARQPRSLAEAVSTARMLEREGYNFSVGLAQVNRHNLASQGLDSYEQAFEVCPNLRAGARILADCHQRAGQDWGKALSCYYSGNFVTGFRHGYVQKVLTAWTGGAAVPEVPPIGLVQRRARNVAAAAQAGSSPPLWRNGTTAAAARAHASAQAIADPAAPATGPVAPGQAVAGPLPQPSPQGPVVVQSMQSADAPKGAPALAQQGAPSADAAFVFEQ